MRLALVTPPAEEPVSATEAKAHLRVDGSTEDTLIAALIVAAREQVEAQTRRALVTQTWDMTLDCFPPDAVSPIRVPLPPLASVTSITYVDSAGDEQTLDAADYDVINGSGPYAQPASIVPAYGTSWPSTRSHPGAVTVRFVAGYGDAEDVPGALRQAILMHVGDLYEHREDVVVGTVATAIIKTAATLLAPYKVVRL